MFHKCYNNNATGNFIFLMNVSLQNNWNDRKGLAEFRLSVLDLEGEEIIFHLRHKWP